MFHIPVSEQLEGNSWRGQPPWQLRGKGFGVVLSQCNIMLPVQYL